MNVRIAHLVSINAGAWYDGQLEMNQYTIKLWMMTQTHSAEEQTIAFSRAKHFLYNQLENTIFINEKDPKCDELAGVGLNITTMPGDPADQLIGIMLFYKLNAVMEGRIEILEVEISSGDAMIYLHCESETSENLIPPTWWTTPDLVHNNHDTVDSEKILAIPQSTSWRELDLEWPKAPEHDNHGNIVVFADFKQPSESE